MFLLPALGSFAADIVVIILHSDFKDVLKDKGMWSIENTSYLPTLSITRLLLLLPLNYHVYSGTRLKFPIVYTLLHLISGFIVFCHFCAFSILLSENFYSDLDFSPDDWEKDAPTTGFHDDITPNEQSRDDSSGDLHEFNGLDDETKEHDVIWILLILSIFSIGLHVSMLIHVRSTAPSNDAMKKSIVGKKGEITALHSYKRNGNRKKRLGYWIYNQYRNGRPFQMSSSEDFSASLSSGEDPEVLINGAFQSPLQMRGRGSDHDADLSVDGSESSGLESGLSADSSAGERDAFLTHDIFNSANTNSLLDRSDDGRPSRRKNRQRTSSGVFGIGIHRCFSTGYDDFMGEIRARFTEAKREWTSRLEDVTHRMHQNEKGANKNILSQFNQNTPFRVLLHMYAHEEVFRNKRLDRAFPYGDSLLLSFYAPQLLCFLLHNAFLSTGTLEKWILDRCMVDVHFAHRCFWFIRAWCLQGGIFIPDEENGKPLPTRTLSGSFLHEEKLDVPLFSTNEERCQSQSEPDFGSITELVRGPTLEDLKRSNGIKFPPEERQALEHFLTKVTECGEYAARSLEFGVKKDSLDSIPAPAIETSPLHERPFVPIDPTQEYPTVGHYNAATSTHHHGFLPHSRSSMRFNRDGEEVRSFFLRTPDFLDSLISIADDLLLQPVSNRTPELRKRLDELEFSMLPSNSIYVPVNGCLHRVWRILAAESIALSTKERVPCIIYLEVIDHSKEGNDTERDTLQEWYKAARPPQRLNTLLSQVTRKTQKGLQKLRDDIEENQGKILARIKGNGGMVVAESDNDDHERNRIQENDPTITPSDLYSPLAAKQVDRDSSSSERTSPESLPSAQKTTADNLGQWISSPGNDNSLIVAERRNSYGSNALTNVEGLDITGENTASLEPVSNKSPRSPLVAFKEDWAQKEQRLRNKSAQGNNPNWRLLPILIKSNDDLRQEQLASQLIQCMASILANARVPTWLYPYDIVALSFRGGIMEAIPDTISIDSLRKNHPHFTDLKHFFEQHFGQSGSDSYENAKANFVESLAAYSIVCYLLQIKDRHNGNILLDNKGHLIHIDFGFFFLSSPGKNSGFESAPFKLTSEFVEVMDGINSHTFNKFRELCYKTFIELRKNCFQITLLVQMLIEGNEDLDCFRGRPHDAVQGLQQRLRLDLNDRACQEYVNTLINDSIGNWTTTCYDRYQRCFVGVM